MASSIQPSSSASPLPSIALAPAQQVEAAIVAGLQNAHTGAETGQIRKVLDLAGEYKGCAGIVVNCADLGGYDDFGVRVLVTVQTTVTCYTHLEDDLDGSRLRDLASRTLDALRGMTYDLDGWRVALPSGYGNWAVTAVSTDGSYRQVALSAEQHLHTWQSTNN